ncbi:DJ-1/PfpI/YhbO family deglycase/protease [Candidatus Bathyarchaeota archaeon]|nr:DJ-1/PfpI/YhbO family deglycase/protease [Candidatus Bathyarchaeota archaeon]NIV43593.1 DJ-1/PfpI/YhbO family deglycase/protease [Candidatus Bathyarchaeota archaeon]
MEELQNKKAIIISTHDFEDTELIYPYYRLKEAGADVKIAALERGTIRGKHGIEVAAELSIKELNADDYDSVIIPGGWAPDRLRVYKEVLDFVAEMNRKGKLIAAICHGPHVLISAGVVKGVKLTAVKPLWDDLKNAGATVQNEAVVRDGNIVTSRFPPDLPQFCKEIISVLSKT